MRHLIQENLLADKLAGGGGAGGGASAGGAAAAAAAVKAAQDQLAALAAQNMQETLLATIESMKSSHASQMTSMLIGQYTEAESQMLKTAQAYLQLAGQAHALINAGIQ